MAQSITSASAVFLIVIPGVYPTPTQLQEFAVDEAFDIEEVEAAVVQTGVDGIGVAGWVPRTYKMPIVLLASSTSKQVFADWIDAQDVNNEVIYASATITIPATKTRFSCAQGSLTRFSRMPNVRRVLQPRRYEITWMPPNPLQKAITAAPA